MTKPFLGILIFSFLYFNVSGQSVDSMACKKVEDTLKIIENLVEDKNSDQEFNRYAAVAFLEELTKIPFDGVVSLLGTEFPSKKYYLKCKKWYLANKKKLRWNARQNKIYLDR